jgi:four helix bundle protein
MNYLKLHIFTEAKRLALEVHQLTMGLPKFEMYEEGSQIRRSSKAIATLIVEGYGRRRYKNDFVRYLIYAHAECDETLLHLSFLYESNSWNDQDKHLRLLGDYKKLSRRINKFILWTENHLETKKPD